MEARIDYDTFVCRFLDDLATTEAVRELERKAISTPGIARLELVCASTHTAALLNTVLRGFNLVGTISTGNGQTYVRWVKTLAEPEPLDNRPDIEQRMRRANAGLDSISY